MGGRGNATDRASTKFGGGTTANMSLAGGGTVEGYGKAEQALARKIFGKNVSAQEVANMAGAAAFSGANVKVKINGDGQLEVNVKHKYITTKRDEGMIRRMYKDSKGRTRIYNDQLYLTKAAQGKGLGTEAFATQVRAAKANKVSAISTYAARNDAAGTVGYKVWADLGYNGVIPRSMQDLYTQARMVAGMPRREAPQTIRELYAGGGRKLWHKYGGDLPMVFSLSRGSDSLKTLNKYLKGKGKKGV